MPLDDEYDDEAAEVDDLPDSDVAIQDGGAGEDIPTVEVDA